MERVLQYEENLPVNVEALTVDSFPLHFHRDMQIIYVLKGQIDLKLSFITYNLKAGDMHFIHRNDIHSLKGVSKDNLVLLFNVNVEAFSALYPDFHMQIFTTRVSKNFVTYEKKLRLRDDIFKVLTELTEKEAGYQSRIYDIAKDVLRILYKDFRGFYIDTEKKVFRHTVTSDPMQTDRLSRVTNYVYENYPYKISLNEIAQSEHISKFYLSHLFHKYVGPSFRDFVAMVRVEMSEHQLLDSDMPITRITQECGFSHPKYYIEHFQNWFGYHPNEYREIFRKETVNHIVPRVENIPLEDILDYQDTIPMFEGEAGDETNKYRSLNFKISSRVEAQIAWSGMLEVNVDNLALSNVDIRSMYLDFYEKIMEKGIRTSTSNEAKSSEVIDYFKFDPQKIAIEKLQSLINDFHTGKRLKWKADFADIMDGRNGLVTHHGLQKPLYHLFMFFSEMYEDIITIEKNYIICQSEKNIKILLFNSDPVNMYHLDVIPDGVGDAYRLTEQRLASDMCFFERWKQLDYKADLSKKEKTILNAMSFPAGRFETIPDIRQFVYHCDMSPLEIIQLDLVNMA